MSHNSEPNNDLYETHVGRSLHISKGVGALAIGAALLSVSVGYYITRKIGGGMAWGARRTADSIAGLVEHDYSDSQSPITITRTTKKNQ